MKKQAEKRQQQQAGLAQAQTRRIGSWECEYEWRCECECTASPMSVNSVLGRGEDERVRWRWRVVKAMWRRSSHFGCDCDSDCDYDHEYRCPDCEAGVEWVSRSATTLPSNVRGETGSHREILEWLIEAETSHFDSGYARKCKDGT